MIDDLTLLALFLLTPSQPIRGGHHTRLLILAAAGLAGMYMVHLLAQDYNTYQCYNNQSASYQRPKFLGKRSLRDMNIFGLRKRMTSANESRDSKGSRKAPDHANMIARLDAVLRFDPMGCARRYVCTVAAKSGKTRTTLEKNIINMVKGITRKDNSAGQKAFRSAMQVGQKTRDANACSREFPKCLFSTAHLLRLMTFFG